MVLLNAWRLEGRRLVSLLVPGERVLAFTPTSLERTTPTALEKKIEETVDKAEQSGSPFWKVAGVVAAIVDYAPSVGDKVVEKFENEPVGGAEGSTARTIGAQVDTTPMGDKNYLAVTDRRLLIMRGSFEPQEPLILITDVDRSLVRTAEVRANLLSGSTGRLRITFTDDSWLEFADVVNMGRHRANQVRDALVEGRSSVEGEPGPPPR
jgi:hypothetical protein